MQSTELTVDQFFETYQLTNAVLILKKPHFEQKEMIKEQKDSTVIRKDKGGKNGLNKRDRFNKVSTADLEKSKKTKAQIEQFLETYPNMQAIYKDSKLDNKRNKKQLENITGTGSRSF